MVGKACVDEMEGLRQLSLLLPLGLPPHCPHPHALLPTAPLQPGEVESLRHLFQHLDEDATGTISMAQLQDAMRHMGKQVGGVLYWTVLLYWV